jgi:serine/threonine-protein kinase
MTATTRPAHTPSSTSTRTAPVKQGQILAGKYRVESVLGAGGMGVVVAARRVGFDQDVAIKFLASEALQNGEAVARFQREARAAVKLKSEHVARVLDVGSLESGSPYIVMELLQGVDLGELLDAGSGIAVGDAVDYVMQACEAIAEAHANGIVHRDLKPRNLFLTSRVDGRPLIKVLDFGISKLLEGGTDGADFTLTSTTDVVGSPSYMSPEQLRSARDIDERTDIWSLGVILYELITGQLPFRADTVPSIVLTIAQEPPPAIRGIRPEVPEGLETAILKCLEKDRTRRYGSVEELATALEPFLAPETTTVAERIASVRKVARNTRRPPSSAPKSTRVAVSGGTSVSWGETEVGPSHAPVAKGSKKPLLAALAVVIFGASGIAAWRYRDSSTVVLPPQHGPQEALAPTAEIPTVRNDDTVVDASLALDPPTATPSARKIYPRPQPVRSAQTAAAPPSAASAPPSTSPRQPLPIDMPDQRK